MSVIHISLAVCLTRNQTMRVEFEERNTMPKRRNNNDSHQICKVEPTTGIILTKMSLRTPRYTCIITEYMYHTHDVQHWLGVQPIPKLLESIRLFNARWQKYRTCKISIRIMYIYIIIILYNIQYIWKHQTVSTLACTGFNQTSAPIIPSFSAGRPEVSR